MTTPLFRSLSVLRPDDPDLSNAERWRVQVYRLLCLLAALLIPAFGLLYRMQEAPVVDPMWVRVLLSVSLCTLVATSYVTVWIRRYYVPLMLSHLYGLMTWFAVVAGLNQLSGDYAVGLLFVFCVLSICVGVGIDTSRPLTWFLSYGVLLVGGVCWMVPEPKTRTSILLACVVALAIVLYLVVRAQLSVQRSLRHMTEEAQAANRLKSALLSNMSHEIRTPLTTILGFAELIAEADTENPHSLATRIHESGERLLDTLNAVLQVSRLESGSVTLTRERLDVTAVVSKRVHSFEEMAQNQGVKLFVDVPDETIWAHLDPDALEQIVDALVRNAVEFSERGNRACVAVQGHAEYFQITVKDTGIGMSDDVLDEVFDAFLQESVGQDRTHEGPGLGLTVAHRLVDLLDGSIDVDSEKGEGTQVVVRLPRHEPVPA